MSVHSRWDNSGATSRAECSGEGMAQRSSSESHGVAVLMPGPEDALRDGVTDVLVIGTPPSRKSAQRVDRVQLADEAIGAAGGRAAEEVTPGRDQWARLSTSCSENVVSFDTFPGRPFQ